MSETCRITGPRGAIECGPGRPLVVIAGPCVLESEETNLEIGRAMAQACAAGGLPYVFKASFDKANRSSAGSPRGPGVDAGLAALAALRKALGVPITTDVHLPAQAAPVAEVVDVIQIPAFLCRQTDLLTAAGKAANHFDRAVNVKKGQFLSPREMSGPIGKLGAAGCRNLMITERGTFFGYHRLVNDFVGIGELLAMSGTGNSRPAVCFDATHSVQTPGTGDTTGGRPEFVPLLARASVAAGVHAVFLECHPEPTRAQSDASTMLSLAQAVALVKSLARLAAARGQ